MQRALILLGVAVLLIGIGWPWLSRLPLGHLPGDITFGRPGFRIYFPLTTMIVVSVILSLLSLLLRLWQR